MRIRASTAFAIYAAAEAALMVWVATRFGTPALIWVLVGGLLVGMLVMRVAGLSAGASLARAARRSAPVEMRGADGTEQVLLGGAPDEDEVRRTARRVGSSGLLFMAGLLLAAPGLISDAVGLVLLLPAVRGRIVGRIAGSLRQQQSATVVVVEPAEPATDGPPVIIGEILPPPDDGGGNEGNNSSV